jgi:uncharacterized protein (DUF2132 family)
MSDPIFPISHPRDPLHGITLETILNTLVQRHGWGEMSRRIPIRCFMFNPTVKSCAKRRGRARKSRTGSSASFETGQLTRDNPGLDFPARHRPPAAEFFIPC